MRLLSRLFLTLLLFFITVSQASAQDTEWVINSFTSQIEVHQDSSISVKETILVDFNKLNKHGIFRTIPIDYSDRFGNKLNIRLEVNSVTDDVGRVRPFKSRRRGKEIEIKIGDPNIKISGFQTYIINYRVNRAINRFKEHDELYWNITGNEWPVPILNTRATISLPEDATNSICFSGSFGSTLQNCTTQLQGKVSNVRSNYQLYPGEGLTVAISVPKGVIQEIPFPKKFWWFIADNWPYVIPLGTVSVLLWLYWLHGRDERFKSLFDPSKGSEKLSLFTAELIPSTYTPLKDIKPAEAGTLIDETVNIRDIAATIIDLAVRGYLRIEEINIGKVFKRKDYRFIWVNKDTANLEEYESQLILAIFGKSKSKDSILLSKLKYKFSTHLKKIRDNLYDRMTQKGYFSKRPDKVVITYVIIGIIIAFLGTFVIAVSLAWAIAFIISGVLVILFSKAMPKRTAYGRKQYLRILGLRNFVSLGAYREKLWERANLFEEVMPYAIAFNLTHKWAEAFENVSVTKPTWYSGTKPFNANSFAYSMESFTRNATKTLPSTRSASSGGSGFSGGGFSGGGFGGGGGGSW